MERTTIDSLNSKRTKFIQDGDKVYVCVELEALLKGNVTITTHEDTIREEELLNEVTSPIIPPVVVVTTKAIKEVYDAQNLSQQVLQEDVYEYLEAVAEMWSSGNRTASAVTGSLIGKVSKRFTNLNEKLFSIVGGANRDIYLKELIKCNMPLLNELWGNKSN